MCMCVCFVRWNEEGRRDGTVGQKRKDHTGKKNGSIIGLSCVCVCVCVCGVRTRAGIDGV